MSELRVAVVQVAAGLDPAVNRDRLRELVPCGAEGVEGVEGAEGADLVVLPEAFARDFGEAGSDVSGFAEDADGPFGSELSAVAQEHATTVVAGMFERSADPARPFNTLLVRGVQRVSYRKIHLYDSFGYRESDRLVAGSADPVVVDVGGIRLGLQTCYDARFPELSRALVDRGAEVLVVSAAWIAGERKVDHWLTLLRARAIENTVYVVAAAQPGPRYSGHSVVIDPLGDVVAQAQDGEETIWATLTTERLDEARRINPSLANRRMNG